MRRVIPGNVRGDHVATVKNRISITSEGCWEYQGYLNPHSGYGMVGRHEYAHRVMYEWANGAIPAGLYIDHLCRNVVCCNPDHLEAVTQSENIRRGRLPEVNRRRAQERTECRHGHAFTPENTYFRSDGGRDCQTCRANAGAKHRRKLRERKAAQDA